MDEKNDVNYQYTIDTNYISENEALEKKSAILISIGKCYKYYLYILGFIIFKFFFNNNYN